MINLVENDRCTGCGACSFVCPKHCITMGEDSIGRVLPTIDHSECIECSRCVKTCPILSPVEHRAPMAAYAAWSSDVEERRTSASGGIAVEIYKVALEKDIRIAGAIQQDDFSVKQVLASNASDIMRFKNSKYVFCSAVDLYGQIRDSLKHGERSVVIGLPCQIAAIRKIFRDSPNLILADVVCHGTTPASYLLQHISMLEKGCGKTTQRMSFRAPDAYTYTFTFTLYDAKGERFYAKQTKDGDTYQFGYHRGISYRENCYHCPFACGKRISDITLSDYKGLGAMAPCSYNNLKVSSILINTTRGGEIVKELIEGKRIIAEQRPTQEPISGDAQLQHPSVKSKYRVMFEKNIRDYNGDFETAIIPALRRYNFDMRVRSVLHFPIRVARKIKKIIIK